MRIRVLSVIVILLMLSSPVGPHEVDAGRMKLDAWFVSPSNASGHEVSSTRFDTSDRHPVEVPTTVLGGLVQNGIYGDLYSGKNLASVKGFQDILWRTEEMPEGSPFRDPWWFRTSFRSQNGKRAVLHLDGINYRADVWLNGASVAVGLVGPYQRFDMDVVLSKDNSLAVKIHPPEGMDPTFAWVDWNPAPPDRGMGLWGDVYLTFPGGVRIKNVQVMTDVDLQRADSASVSINLDLFNSEGAERECTLSGEIRGAPNSACGSEGDPRTISFSKEIIMKPGEGTVALNSGEFPQLHLRDPWLWWPNSYGKQDLYSLDLKISTPEGVSDAYATRFGIREVASYFNEAGWRGFTVNGRDVLIRGGGYADDILLRPSAYRDEMQVLYAKDMGLNALRMEGVWGSDDLYDLCDEHGILLFVGLCCCSPWERWESWTRETRENAVANFNSSVVRLRNHPSVLCWMYGSDRCPPPEMEREYLAIVEGQDRTRPSLSSATEHESSLTGKTGVKMRGPYDYVPPVYYYEDRSFGGAFGFGTEEGFGPSVPPHREYGADDDAGGSVAYG